MFQKIRNKRQKQKINKQISEQFLEFWIKILFFQKKNYKNSLYLKLMPNLVRLGHVGNSLANVVVLNSDFIIF